MRPLALSALSVLFLAGPSYSQSLRDWTNYTDVNDVNGVLWVYDTLWFATEGGLVRTSESNSGEETRLTNANGLGSNNLRFVIADSNLTVWCGSEDGILSKRRHDNSWKSFLFEDETGLPIPLNAAAPQDAAYLWVGSNKGVHKFDIVRNGGEIKESYTRIGEWADQSVVRDIAVQGGFLWAVGDAGAARADLEDPFLLDRSHWTTWNFPTAATSVVVHENSVYVGTGNGLYVFQDGGWNLVCCDLGSRPIVDLASCDALALWILFDDGFAILDEGELAFGTVPGAKPNGYRTIHCDEHSTWIGQVDGGVWGYSFDWYHFELAGPIDNNLGDIAVDDHGRVWTVHTNRGAGFFVDGFWHAIPHLFAGPSAPLTAVDVAPDGGIWYGHFGGGVWRVDPEAPLDSSTAVNYKQPNSSLMWVQNPRSALDFNFVIVQDVVVDYKGRVWAANAFADSGAVIAWKDGDCWERFDADDGLTSNSPIALYPLDSSVLVGFGNFGVVEVNFREPLCVDGIPTSQTPRLTQKTTADGLPSDLVTSIIYDKLDSLWVGTSLGLAHYSRDRRRFFRIPMPAEAGLTVNALAVDDNNGLWIGTSLGLVIRDADGTMTFYNSKNSGLVGDFVADLDIDRRTGEVWIATRSGVSKTQGPLPQAEDIESTVAYPNPFVIGVDERVRFNAPAASLVTITTVSGHQVISLSSDLGWDGRNAAGEIVATGVYLFAVHSPAGEYGRGKIAVIRR